ncbi:MAG: FAD-binding oxidoreductase [Sneathiella sp.]
MPTLLFDGIGYEGAVGDTVLDVLLSAGADVQHSCKLGRCHTCLLKCSKGDVQPKAQKGLRKSLAYEGYFLACQNELQEDLTIASPDAPTFYQPATILGVEKLSASICRVFLEPDEPFDYQAGQFIGLRRFDGVVRSYSLASIPGLDNVLELHIEKYATGEMSNWIYENAKPGDRIDFQGPNGHCFYMPDQKKGNLLLVGNGTGLAPLLGILKSALSSGHKGKIALYHGSEKISGLYLHSYLKKLEEMHSNLYYFPCISSDGFMEGFRQSAADQSAFSDFRDLKNWRVYLCGGPSLVNSAKIQAYMQGAATEDIYADTFDLKELRQFPRASIL